MKRLLIICLLFGCSNYSLTKKPFEVTNQFVPDGEMSRFWVEGYEGEFGASTQDVFNLMFGVTDVDRVDVSFILSFGSQFNRTEIFFNEKKVIEDFLENDRGTWILEFPKKQSGIVKIVFYKR